MERDELLQRIAALPYYSQHYTNEPAAREIKRLFSLLYPDEERELCKTCNQDFHYRYTKLKSYLKNSGFDMKDQSKFRYRFADDDTMFRVPFENEFYSNANLTDEIAVELIERAPAVKSLLIVDESIPAPLTEKQKAEAIEKEKAEAAAKAKADAEELAKEQNRIAAKVKAEAEAKAKAEAEASAESQAAAAEESGEKAEGEAKAKADAKAAKEAGSTKEAK